MKITLVKLTTGEDLISDARIENDYVILNKPALAILEPSPQGAVGVRLVRYPIFGGDINTHITVNINAVVYMCEPHSGLSAKYREEFGDGLVVPNKKIIV